ncbi:MAG: hypothetical protein WA828_21040, partial [Coleofasciculaceae cyanobacterium]
MCKPVISSQSVNKLTSVGAAPPCLPKDRGFLQLKWSVILLTIALTAGWTKNAQAESPATAPPQLKATLAQIDAAANRRDVNSVMQFYAGNFKHSDGLTRQTMMQALTDLWKRYPQLTYRTELK